MAKLILYVFVVSLIAATLAQDFEPPLLEGPTTTTLEPTTTATETPVTETPVTETPATKTPATETPATKTPATETPATETPAKTTDAPSTKTPETTTIATTTIATIEPVTDSPFPTTQKTTTTPKATTSSTTTRKPAIWYPNIPNFNNICYYKTQQGFPQMRWICGRFKFVTPIQCFHCCLYSNSYFAGCQRVQNHFCQTNNIRNDYDFNYFK